MAVPLKISYRGTERSPDLDRLIAQEAANLEQFYGPLLNARIVVAHDSRIQNHSGIPYQVHISISVPREDVFIQMRASTDPAYTDAEFAIRSAFSKARNALAGRLEVRREFMFRN